MTEEELTEEEEKELEEEKAKAWLTGQGITRSRFIPEAHARAEGEERIKKLEEMVEAVESGERAEIKSESTKRRKEETQED